MRTPVVLVAGQGGTDSVTGALMQRPGTVVVEHRFDGHVVRRTTAMLRRDELTTPTVTPRRRTRGFKRDGLIGTDYRLHHDPLPAPP
jgi:hypothetical protein